MALGCDQRVFADLKVGAQAWQLQAWQATGQSQCMALDMDPSKLNYQVASSTVFLLYRDHTICPDSRPILNESDLSPFTCASAPLVWLAGIAKLLHCLLCVHCDIAPAQSLLQLRFLVRASCQQQSCPYVRPPQSGDFGALTS